MTAQQKLTMIELVAIIAGMAATVACGITQVLDGQAVATLLGSTMGYAFGQSRSRTS